ncbi:MAG: hypothetical protein L7H13_08025 [Sulfolobales archaeon]|nr:hypothetical protein [Sulfolobales archaeon]
MLTRARRGSERAIFIETVALIALTLLAIGRNLEKEVFECKGHSIPILQGGEEVCTTIVIIIILFLMG